MPITICKATEQTLLIMEGTTNTHPGFKTALKFWFKLGWISFGGTAGHIAIMHDYLVDKKQWISNTKFLHALNHCMLLPGPEAQQLSIYIGWLLHGKRGGLAAGILFVLPSMFILLGLSITYVLFGNIPWVTALFAGLKPAVIALIIVAMYKIAKKALHSPLHYFLAAIAFVCIFFFNISLLAIIGGVIIFAICCKVIYPRALQPATGQVQHAVESSYVLDQKTAQVSNQFTIKTIVQILAVGIILWLLPFLLFFLLLPDFTFWKQLSLFFTQTAFVTVGGSYTVLPYVAQFTVTKLNWLSKLQMMDGFALAETTPGPLIIVLSYVGFMAGYNHFNGSLWMGTIGLLATTWFTFLPCFGLIFIGAPLIEKTHGNALIENTLSFITAAVVGVILHLTIYLGKDALFPQGIHINNLDYMALIWIIVSLVLILRWQVNILYLIGLSMAYGWVHYVLQ